MNHFFMIIMIFLLSLPMFAQLHLIGGAKAPHILLQTRADADARTFVFTQLKEVLDACCQSKQFLKKDLNIKQNELFALLALEKMKPHLAETLTHTLLFDMKKKGIPKDEIKKILTGELDYSQNEEFLNRAMVSIKLNKLTYNIDPSKIQIKQLSATSSSENLIFDLEAHLSGMDIDAKDICISFGTFHKIKDGSGFKIIKKESEYQCDHKDDLDQAIDRYIQNSIENKEDNTVVINQQETLGTVSYLRKLGVHLQGIRASIKDVTPFIINLSLELGLQDSEVNFRVTKGSLSQLLTQATSEVLKPRIDLIFLNDQVGQIYGFPGVIVENTPIHFDDKEINQALDQRKQELLELLIAPIVNDLENMTKKITDKASVQLAGKFKLNPKEEIHYHISQFAFLSSDLREQLAMGFNFQFPLAPSTGDLEKDQQEDEIPEAEQVISSLEKLIMKPTHDDMKAEADIVLSIGEHLFNDALSFVTQFYKDEIEKNSISLANTRFHISDLPLEIQNIHPNENPVHTSYLTSCVEVIPSKKWQRILLRVALGNQVNIPLFAFVDIKLVQEADGTPVMYFDIPMIESSKDYLSEDFNHCKISKRLKKLAAKISGKLIDKKYNSYNSLPLIKVSLKPLQGIPSDLLKLRFDRENKRMNLLISLKTDTQISGDIIEKVEIKAKKVEISFPKIEALKKK